MGTVASATGRARQLPLHLGGPHRDPGLYPRTAVRGGMVKFLLSQGHHPLAGRAEPQPRAAGCRVRGAREAWTGVPVVRFKAGESKEDLARPYQDAAAAAATGLVLVGKAQERTSSWRGFVDDTHAAHRPSHPHIAWRRQSSVPDHWYFYFADDRVGTGVHQAVHLCALSAVGLRQRTRVGQAPARQGRDRLRGPRQRPTGRGGPRGRPSHLRPPRCRACPRPARPHDGRRARPPHRR